MRRASPGGRTSSATSGARGALRILGRPVDRLSVRLALGISALVVIPLGLGFFALSTRHFEGTLEMQREAAELQNRILETALRHQMKEKDLTLMSSILREVGEQPGVQGAMILNHDGEVRMASRPELIGDVLSQDSPACAVCHAQEPDNRDRWTLLGEEGEVLRTALPIENGPDCHACHDPEQRLNGILLVDLSRTEVLAQLDRDRTWIVMGTAGVIAALLLGISLFVRRVVLLRLARLSRSARSIAAGNLSERVADDGDDVISSLAHDFDDMARSISGLVAEVREHEERLSNVLNSLDDGLVVLDRDARVVASNRSFGKRVAEHPEVIAGRRCRGEVAAALPCCERPGDCPASQCLSSGRVQRETYRTQGPSGDMERVEEVYACPVFDTEGEVEYVVEVWRDISERVREEEKLAEFEHLVSLGALASGFSHEVNTPLATMLTCAQSVIDRAEEMEAGGTHDEALQEIRESADLIRGQVHRCRNLTEQFRRFSRGIPPAIEPQDLGETVASVVVLVRPTAVEANASIELELDGELPPVAANPEVVQHVVLNLLVNAIESLGPDGGSIAVSLAAGEDVRIRVVDTGCGIAPEARPRIFEPFRSGKARGTGLGLFLSRSFVRRFGGDVRLVRSEVGVGSTFEVILARADGADGADA
jgi:signal transduction histidine kinase